MQLFLLSISHKHHTNKSILLHRVRIRILSRAKRIVNQVSKNEVMDAKALAARMETQNELIEVLRAKLQKGEELGFIEDSKGETVRVSLSPRCEGSIPYAVGVVFNVEWCIRQLSFSSVILYNITSMAYHHPSY